MPLRLRWLGTACFEVVAPSGESLVIDPYLDDSISAPFGSQGIQGADYIFITHGHYDHILDVGKLAARFNSRVFASSEAVEAVTAKLGVDPAAAASLTAGDRVKLAGLAVEVLSGIHVDLGAEFRRLTGKEPPGGDPSVVAGAAAKALFDTDWLPPEFTSWLRDFPAGEQLNYVFDFQEGPRVYMAGTRPDLETIGLAETARADITLLQVLPGRTLIGKEEETAALAAASGCRMVIPQHHDALLKGAHCTDLSRLTGILDKKYGIELRELEPGRWFRVPEL